MKLRKGDKVRIIKGRDRGRESEVSRVLSGKGKVFVSGVNVYKRHAKPSAKNKEGGIIEIQKPLAVENVMLVCPLCQLPTRVGRKRVCKKCQGKL